MSKTFAVSCALAVSTSMATQLKHNTASLAQVCSGTQCHSTDGAGHIYAPEKPSKTLAQTKETTVSAPPKAEISTLAQTKKATVSAPAKPEMTLAQTQSSNHDCMYTQNRNKAAVDDFHTIVSGTANYNDQDFTPDNSSLYWSDMSETLQDLSAFEWKRAKDLFTDADNHLWGSNGVSPNDFKQGALGNCWFLAGASALAEHPNRIERMFLNEQSALNAAGIYAINLYALGVPHTVVVDDWLPTTYNQYTQEYSTLFNKVGRDGSLWSVIIEKAFAKYHGNYAHIASGNPLMSVQTLSGAPGYSIMHNTLNIDALWEKLQFHDGRHDVMQAGTAGSNDSYTNSDGLYFGHAFTTLGVVRLSNGVRLVKMRNPHGVDTFRGRWSDDSNLWTDQFKQEAGFTHNKQDGQIFMQLEDYHTQVEETYVNYETGNWHRAYFMQLDDTLYRPGSYPWCGSACTRHSLTLTSSVAQTIYVTGHTWDRRSYGKACTAQQNAHSIKVPSDQYVRQWRTGSNQLEAFTMAAGESIQIDTEWNFSDAATPKDWSVVVHAELGEVTLTHNDGLQSDHMPLAPPRSGDTPAPVPRPTPAPQPTPTPTPTPAPTPTPVDPVDNRDESTFREFVESYTPEGCAGLSEQRYTNEAGSGGYQTVMKHTCAGATEFTVKMSVADWDSVKFFYQKEDANEVLIRDTKHVSCTDAGDDRTCIFNVGNVSDWQNLGLPSDDQPMMGFRCEAGAYGIKSQSSRTAPAPTPAPTPVPTPTPQPTPTPTPSGRNQDERDFNSYVNSYAERTATTTCSGIQESQYTNQAGNTGYQTAMKHTCDNGYTKYSIVMSQADWDSVVFLYHSDDETHYTVLNNCVDDGVNRTCELYLGDVPEWQALGLNSANQPMMGWRNEAGDYGIRSQSSTTYSFH